MSELSGGHEGRRWRDNYTIIFPNLFTLGNLFCGFFSVISSLKGNFELAAYMIILASVFDLVDGRVARILKGVTVFGKELDSLCDVISFGFAPTILAYLSVLSDFNRLGWLIAFLFLASSTLRLARFNATASIQDPSFFMGLPVPIAAVWVVSGFLFFQTNFSFDYSSHIFAVMFVVVSLLMVSTVKYNSYKKPKRLVKKELFKNTVKLLFAVVIIAFKPSVMLFVVVSFYILWGLAFKLVSKKRNS